MKVKNHFVRTPKEVTEKLLELEKFEGDILECCCGDGSISKVLIEKGYNVKSSDKFDYGYGEIKDLFDINIEYDNCITNPPFFLMKEGLIQKLLKITKKKLALLWYVKNIGNVMESKKNSKNLKAIYMFNKEINWKEARRGWLFAWYVWEKGYEGKVIIERINL